MDNIKYYDAFERAPANNHFNLLDTIDQLAGTNLAGGAQSVNQIQDAVTKIEPAIIYISNNYIKIALMVFAVMVLAGYIGSKLAK